jgi:curved DNA-binding protein CbpA
VNAFVLLDVARDATDEEIRRAYKYASAETHPDRHGGSPIAAEVFREVQVAYAILSDPEKKRAHEAELDALKRVPLIDMRPQVWANLGLQVLSTIIRGRPTGSTRKKRRRARPSR